MLLLIFAALAVAKCCISRVVNMQLKADYCGISSSFFGVSRGDSLVRRVQLCVSTYLFPGVPLTAAVCILKRGSSEKLFPRLFFAAFYLHFFNLNAKNTLCITTTWPGATPYAKVALAQFWERTRTAGTKCWNWGGQRVFVYPRIGHEAPLVVDQSSWHLDEERKLCCTKCSASVTAFTLGYIASRPYATQLLCT